MQIFILPLIQNQFFYCNSSNRGMQVDIILDRKEILLYLYIKTIQVIVVKWL